MADLTELRERVEDCRASLAFRAGDMAGEPAKYTVALDALLTAHRALCLAEAREAVGNAPWRYHEYDYEGVGGKLLEREEALAALDALQEGT